LVIFAERIFKMTIKEKQQEIIDEFAFLEDWEQRYEYIIDLGKELKGLPDDKKADENLIKGCQSKVWIDAEFREGKLFFNADSDGILPKGIVSLLVSIYSGHSTQEILDSDFNFISEIGLQEFLSPSRANGLMAMTKQIKFYAVAYQLKS
jgi:cysteine desulfuration protein SufE